MNIKAYGKASKVAIENFEKVIDFSLSKDYKDFLGSYNGGSFKDTIFL